ncbi:response regulator transcription factor [uncultured Roseobacter sp.]|uniref:response regulator n=1 Tax=uncultured Roseobacter sp. TaxID=114847 RepID=UPI002632841B|nr:response regulator transcription factor [uncultured Roseobacter sp.]
MTDQTILVVEDDSKIRTLLRNVMEDEGYSVLEADSAVDVLETIKSTRIDLITLDIHLGSENGLELAKEIRRISDISIIMLTGKGDVIDRVVGLEVGADDYITKPFHVREVIARIRSVLRRAGDKSTARQDAHAPGAQDAEGGAHFRFDGMTAFPDRLEVLDRKGLDCRLTSGDFKLLSVFLHRPKRVLSRDQLMDLTGGAEWSPLDRTIDNQVARLRKKIERDPSDPKLIKTVRGVGYTFACDVQTVQPSDPPAKSA